MTSRPQPEHHPQGRKHNDAGLPQQRSNTGLGGQGEHPGSSGQGREEARQQGRQCPKASEQARSFIEGRGQVPVSSAARKRRKSSPEKTPEAWKLGGTGGPVSTGRGQTGTASVLGKRQRLGGSRHRAMMWGV